MKPLLEVHDTPPSERPSHDCPGALLPLTVQEYDALQSAGELFATDRRDMSSSERRSARVMCKGRPVLRWESLGRMFFNALCSSCAELEKAARAQARTRAAGR